MRKLFFSILTIILCAISFFAGTAFNTINIAKDTLNNFEEFTKLVADPELQIRRDIGLYERAINYPEEVSKAIRFFILTKYDWDNRCVGDLCEEFNMNSPTYESNQVIIDFLNNYPVEECRNLEVKQRVECNLELVP